MLDDRAVPAVLTPSPFGPGGSHGTFVGPGGNFAIIARGPRFFGATQSVFAPRATPSRVSPFPAPGGSHGTFVGPGDNFGIIARAPRVLPDGSIALLGGGLTPPKPFSAPGGSHGTFVAPGGNFGIIAR